MQFARQARAPDVTPYQTGLATWYGAALAGRKTASGERFDPGAHTAAHKTLPMNTWVEVRRVDTGRVVRVRINDRGPHGDPQRIIDVSRRAAEELDLVREGVARVELRLVSGP
jgi:rare lipoprotein A